MSDVKMLEPVPTMAVADLPGNEHIDDKEDAGGVDKEIVAKADERKSGTDLKEEAREVIEESEKVASAKLDDGNDVEGGGGEGEVNGEVEAEAEAEERAEEGKPKKRPERPKMKAADCDVEKESKALRRGRLRVESNDVAAFVSDRPTRERKSIDRFTASAEKDKPKELQIKEGGGTPLRKIPNFVYKLSKRSRHDETLSQLHSVLFNKRGKATVLKQNILQFSGYVWIEDEVKERAKIREKLERFTRESLLHFLDLLDVHVSKTLKKEDLISKLLEFLEKPHKTTDRLLEVKEQEKKSSGKKSSSTKGPGRPKIRKGDEMTLAKKKSRKTAAEDGDSDASEMASDSESPVGEIEQKRLTSKDETDREEESMVEEKKQASNSSTAVKEDTEVEGDDEEKKGDSARPRKKPKVETPDATLKLPSKSADRFYSKKKFGEDVTMKETSISPSKKRPGRPKKSLENSAKKTPKQKDAGMKASGKGSSANKRKAVPSDEELQAKIRKLLREADFSKVTFTDVVSELEEIFGVNLTEKKVHVKGLIRDEISKIAADEEPDEEMTTVEAA